ncbi:MAG TPA: adenosyl-hopene transferase HpnH [Patescibacteria group bacterium]|nr:adenosyl-hopene transferase HpnH [Patescibacteria group bacterium]
MRFPLHITTDMMKHQIRHGLKGNTRYPFVLMLEPLYTCNLACLGCSVERHTGRIEDRLTLEECLKAADDSGAPVVSLCGGEPTIYPELKGLVDGIIARKRHVYLCTNGLLLDRTVYGQIAPHNRLTINIHLDGLKRTHDQVCDREGVFDKALAMIKEGKRFGYRITTNTTVFKETDMDEVEALCRILREYQVDGMLLSPGYQYASVESDFFLVREEIHHKFQRVLELSKRYRLTSTPMFLEFAAGLREYPCSPWSTVTYTPQGWKGPCYLIEEKYYRTFEEFWQSVDWDYWESRQDPRCYNCKMHSGFEASVVRGLGNSPKDMLRMAVWNFLE